MALSSFLFPRTLQAEYDHLHQASLSHEGENGSPVGGGSEQTEEMLAEAELLRQHKARLEARMRVLEDHNQQLESQLGRLRHLLDQVSIFLLLLLLVYVLVFLEDLTYFITYLVDRSREFIVFLQPPKCAIMAANSPVLIVPVPLFNLHFLTF